MRRTSPATIRAIRRALPGGPMHDRLPEELRMLAVTVREFARERLDPLWQQVEREDCIPPEVLREMGDLGLFGAPIEEEYGGLGAGETGYSVVMEALGATSAAYMNVVGASCGLFGMT